MVLTDDDHDVLAIGLTITTRMILSHRAGLPVIDAALEDPAFLTKDASRDA